MARKPRGAVNSVWEASLTPITASIRWTKQRVIGVRDASHNRCCDSHLQPHVRDGGSIPPLNPPRRGPSATFEGGGLTSLAALLLLGAFAASAAAADNWSRFRGPNGAGYAPAADFPAEWSDDDYDWKKVLPGTGHSSPVGWHDKLFVTSGDEDTGELIITALDAEEGDELWNRRYPTQPHSMHPSNSYASSTPAVDDHGVYVAWASPGALEIAALSHDGDELWRRDLGPIENNHGFGVSPIVLDGMVILANDNTGPSFIVAFDAATGDERWRRKRRPGTPSYATPAVLTAADGVQQLIVCSTAEGMTAVAPQTGDSLWQAPDVFPDRCVGSPLVAGGMAFASSGEGGAGKSFTAVAPPGPADGEPKVAYDLRKSLPQVPTPVATDNLLFVWSDRGVVTCCDLATGKVHWSERVEGKYFGSPVIAGDKLYAISADGHVAVVLASERFELLGRVPLGEPSQATPAIHQGRMYLRTESVVRCLPGGI